MGFTREILIRFEISKNEYDDWDVEKGKDHVLVRRWDKKRNDQSGENVEDEKCTE